MKYEEQIAVMQNNLKHIRIVLELSGSKFGELIGVTKQTIGNIESGKNKLSDTQYLAIMYVLSTEILPNLNDIQREYVENYYLSK